MNAHVDIIRDIVYRTIDGRALRLDLRRPRVDGRAPVVVYFHGGGYQVGARTDHEDARAQRLAERGVAVASVEYRFTDTATFPAQIQDARSAVEWVRASGAEFGLAVDRVGAWGASAGGQLAALLGLGTPGERVAPSVQAAVPWFAPLDMAARFGGAPLDEALHPPLGDRALLGDYDYVSTDPRHVAADPMANVSGTAADFLIFTGDRDRVVPWDDSRRFHDSLVRAGVPSTLVIVGGAGHEDSAFEDPAYLSLIAEFFRTRLESEPVSR